VSQSPRFWNRIAKRYARQPIADEASYQRKLAATRSHLRPDMELLEIGCGTGSTAINHAPHVKHIRATDISPKMLEIAGEKAREAGVHNVTFEQGTVESMDVPVESVDMVLAMSILHLVENPEAAIRSCHQALKPGGRLVSSTACLGDNLKIFKYIGPLGAALGLIPRVQVFTRAELEALIMGAGFVIEEAWQPGKNKGVFIVARKSE
jgi:2-polyprenyl-3-methyl-5-hydroxy-6-metoxy-1,4-benzoquinol methylase